MEEDDQKAAIEYGIRMCFADFVRRFPGNDINTLEGFVRLSLSGEREDAFFSESNGLAGNLESILSQVDEVLSLTEKTWGKDYASEVEVGFNV